MKALNDKIFTHYFPTIFPQKNVSKPQFIHIHRFGEDVILVMPNFPYLGQKCFPTMGRIAELIDSLNLKAHPEGGYYSETFRDAESVETKNGSRSLATSIYFLLSSHNVSKFHSIAGQEIWFHHEGSPLTVHVLTESGYQRLKVGPVGLEGSQPQVLVPEGSIFGSTVDGENSYALVSCTVVPGFDFADFRMYSAEELLEKWPEHGALICRLT